MPSTDSDLYRLSLPSPVSCATNAIRRARAMSPSVAMIRLKSPSSRATFRYAAMSLFGLQMLRRVPRPDHQLIVGHRIHRPQRRRCLRPGRGLGRVSRHSTIHLHPALVHSHQFLADRAWASEHPTPRKVLMPDIQGPTSTFRFFDNREKYLLFVNTCNEKQIIAERVALDTRSLRPTPPRAASLRRRDGRRHSLDPRHEVSPSPPPHGPLLRRGKRDKPRGRPHQSAEDGGQVLRAPPHGDGRDEHALHGGSPALPGGRVRKRSASIGWRCRWRAARRSSSTSRYPTSRRRYSRGGRPGRAGAPAIHYTPPLRCW